MSYSGSGAVATLRSPSNYNGATKIPVPSTTRRYSTTSSTSAYRTSGSQERSYYSSATNSYTTASRNVQTEYRSRYTTPIRSSASVPTSYSSRISDLHETSNRLTSKERSETNESLLNYRRSSKTDNDVAAMLEKYGFKSDVYKLRNDAMPSRFLNTSNLDSKFSSSRKLAGSSTLDLSRLSNASGAVSSKPPKTGLSSRLQRKDSLTKSEHADSSSIRGSLERKISSSAIGGSSSPIEIRKPSEVWDKQLSVSYGENASMGGGSEGDLSVKVEVEKEEGREGEGEGEGGCGCGGDSGEEVEKTESEEKALTFDEIRKKFDGGMDSSAVKGGSYDSSKSSPEEGKESVGNGVVMLGVENVGEMHNVDRDSMSRKARNENEEGEVEAGEKWESNKCFSSPQTLRRTVLKPIPSAVKNSNSNSILRKSPDPHTDVSTGLKKKSSPDLKKSPTLSPEKKEGFSTLAKLPAIPAADAELSEKRADEGEPRREIRNASVTSKLGLEMRSDLRIQPKPRGEKLVSKIEATLLKQPDLDNEVLNTLSRIRKTPESKPKDFDSQTKVIELRRLDPAVTSPFDVDGKKPKDHDNKDRLKEKKPDSATAKPHTTHKAYKPIDKTRTSPQKDPAKSTKDNTDTLTPPPPPPPPPHPHPHLHPHPHPHPHKKDNATGTKTKSSPTPTPAPTPTTTTPVPTPTPTQTPNEDNDSHNLNETHMKNPNTQDLTKDTNPPRNHHKELLTNANEIPMWDKHQFTTNLSNRTCSGQASTSQGSNSHSFTTDRLRHGVPSIPSQDACTSTWTFTCLLQLPWLALVLAAFAAFIVGTLAPLAPSNGNLFALSPTIAASAGGAPNGTRTFKSFAKTPSTQASDQENPNFQGASPRSSLGRSRSSGGEKGGLNGLKNIGNTCFMNSVLQCLSNTKPLLEYLLHEDYLSDINFTISAMKGSLIKAFSNVIQELWAPNTEDRIINTTNFKSQIQKFAPRFMGYAQQDAQEFLRYLLEGLHEDVNRVTVKPQQILSDIEDSLSDNQKATEAWKRYLRMDDSKVVDIFVGQLKSTLQCTVCGHCSVTFDPFWDLSLPVPSRTVQPRLSSCLDAFTKEEVLDGEEKPTCSKCETRRKCTKSFSIQKFPKILVLHLKRFSPTERYRGKLSVTVDFPLTGLDLSPYAANKGQGCTYNLYAISNHSGTAYGGHYTAYCKHPYTGNWHEYNDSRVSSLSSRSVVSGEAYVLFYELATQTSHL